MKTSERLLPLRQNIELVWKRHLKEETFSSWSVLKTYALYRRYILQDSTNATILEDYCQIMEQRLKSRHETTYGIKIAI